jgi:thiol-disulfide isomerase/thioredoxin
MQSLCLIIALLAVDPPQIFSATGIYARTQQDQAVETSPYYVIFFTASYCGPCHQYKDSGKFDELQKALATKGIRIREVDFQKEPGFYYGSVPKFRLGKVDTEGRNVRVAEWPAGELITSQQVLEKIKEQTKDSSDVK